MRPAFSNASVGASRRVERMLAIVAAAFSMTLGLAFSAGSLAHASAGADYKVTKSVPLGSPDRWDYVVFDAPSHRVYVAHGDRLTVVDGHSGQIVGQVESLPGGTHGIAISHSSGLG